jgi:hypothetical protein
MVTKRQPYRSDIDGLRAIAVLAIVIFHGFPGLLPGGFVGVDIFFVISGFLISNILLTDLAHGRFSFQDFYTSRIRRIFPALILVLGITLVIGWFILLSGEFKNLGINAAAAAVFSANLLQWRQVGYFDPTADVKPLLHLWSLGVEEQFYLAWPLLLVPLWRSQKNTGPTPCRLGCIVQRECFACVQLSDCGVLLSADKNLGIADWRIAQLYRPIPSRPRCHLFAARRRRCQRDWPGADRSCDRSDEPRGSVSWLAGTSTDGRDRPCYFGGSAQLGQFGCAGSTVAGQHWPDQLRTLSLALAAPDFFAHLERGNTFRGVACGHDRSQPGSRLADHVRCRASNPSWPSIPRCRDSRRRDNGRNRRIRFPNLLA